MTIKAYASAAPGKPLELLEYDPGDLGPNEVEINVEYCGVCHSDLSMLHNDWQITQYPLVPGHEAAGTIGKVGADVKTLKPGDTVGLGWMSSSCMHCDECMSGDHNLCQSSEASIVGRHGGFANRVRASEEWVVKLPDGFDLKSAGPLFCGGITVFNPILQHRISPTSRVGVVGIGGLGHMALQFLNAWGCHVTAFTSSESKIAEAKEMGAHDTLNSRDDAELEKAANSFDMILVTVNVELNWNLYISLLRPRGVLHFVGAVPDVTAAIFPLIAGQKSIAASPIGSPRNIKRMLEFSHLHNIKPVIETFPMSKVNDAMAHLEAGKARYRIVLENDIN